MTKYSPLVDIQRVSTLLFFFFFVVVVGISSLQREELIKGSWGLQSIKGLASFTSVRTSVTY